CAMSQDAAAKLLNVSRRTVQSASEVRDKGTPGLIRAAEQGKIAVSLAERIAGNDAGLQDAIVRRVERDGTKPQEAYRIERAAKKHERHLREPTGKFRVIYADPPWSYGNSQLSDGLQYSQARDHYPTMALEELCGLPVRGWAEDDAVLFLWATSPILREAFEVVRAWGFEYKASFVWDKQHAAIGHYNGVGHEFLLVCTRGAGTP